MAILGTNPEIATIWNAPFRRSGPQGMSSTRKPSKVDHSHKGERVRNAGALDSGCAQTLMWSSVIPNLMLIQGSSLLQGVCGDTKLHPHIQVTLTVGEHTKPLLVGLVLTPVLQVSCYNTLPGYTNIDYEPVSSLCR